MIIAFYGDSLTAGYPGASYFERLRARLPGDTLLNYGRPNDTARNLYERIVARRLAAPTDTTIVWIGTNDVLVRRSRLFARLRRAWAKTPDAFRAQYRALIELLAPCCGRLIAVSPLCIGEDDLNGWNAQLDLLAAVMQEQIAAVPNGVWLDMRAVLRAAMQGKTASDWQPAHAFQGIIDAATLRTPEQIDRKSAARGLWYTLDGVHLNSAGAALVADRLMVEIERCRG